ncbi:MAG: HlyD family efflux transporter periplasmic adaptor subunit [Phycisphaerales bacterium]|nr:HlyD family efflux transporter periplasmic adaptor subunit [Phycisphaerales bacterium]
MMMGLQAATPNAEGQQAGGGQTEPAGKATNNGAPESPDIAVASVTSFEITSTATGELEARRQIDIRNQLEQPTTIVEIVKEGTQVKAGDVLVRLNADSIQTQVDEETLRVETARAEVVVGENDVIIQQTENASLISKARLEVEVAQLELKKWEEGEVTSKRQANQLALERAIRELDRLGEKYQQSVELEKRGFLSRDELRRDEVAFLEARAALETAKLDIKVYDEFEYVRDRKVKMSAVDQARADLDKTIRKAESELASKEADLRNKREQLRLRQSKLDKLKEQLDLAVLKAPSDGLVVYATSLNRDRWGNNSEGTLDVGRQVTRNQQLIVLPDTSEMLASVRVHESLTGRMRRGQPATIRIDALGGRAVPGAVETIGVIAESGGWRDPNLREYTVKLRLDTSDTSMLKPSMRAEATILLDKVSSALTVPLQSIFNDGLVRYVLVPEGSRFAKRPVRVGRRSDRFAEIVTGLQAGERVLLREPTPSEVVDRPWDAKQLAAVGLNMLPDGRIMPAGGPPGGRPGGGAPAGAGAGGAPTAGGRPAATPAEPAGAGAPAGGPRAQRPEGGNAERRPPAGDQPAAPAAQPAPAQPG